MFRASVGVRCWRKQRVGTNQCRTASILTLVEDDEDRGAAASPPHVSSCLPRLPLSLLLIGTAWSRDLSLYFSSFPCTAPAALCFLVGIDAQICVYTYARGTRQADKRCNLQEPAERVCRNRAADASVRSSYARRRGRLGEANSEGGRGGLRTPRQTGDQERAGKGEGSGKPLK